MREIDCIIVIDPGKSNGGIIVDIKDKQLQLIPMPTNVMRLLDFFIHCKETCITPIAFVEKQSLRHSDIDAARDDPNKKGMVFGLQKLQQNFTEIKTLLNVAGIPFIQLAPQTWRSVCGIGRDCPKDKTAKMNYYKKVASNYFPGVNITHWSAAALLMLQCARVKISYQQNWIRENLPTQMHCKFDL